MGTLRQPGTHQEASVLGKFILGFHGTTLPDELAALLKQGLAGVALFHRNFENLEGLRGLTREIRRAAGRPVLIGIDQEGGTRYALQAPFTVWPAPAALGRLDDAQLIERMARAMARELEAVGCNLNFAPMLDLATNPASPVTQHRSFGADPHRVARLGAAFIRGLAAEGILACAKHFPGHGDTQVDPHEDLPVFHGTAERLEGVELVPFAQAIAAGVPVIMTAHILLPHIDPERPASLSRRLLLETLRQRFGFDGAILADDLGMGAVARRFGPGDAAVETFLAGSDLALLCHDWTAVGPALAGVAKALHNGRFEPAEWQASQQRVGELRARAEAGARKDNSLDVVGCTEHRALAEEIRARTAEAMEASDEPG
jgi:beta-N-acetylhexosaminidase